MRFGNGNRRRGVFDEYPAHMRQHSGGALKDGLGLDIALRRPLAPSHGGRKEGKLLTLRLGGTGAETVRSATVILRVAEGASVMGKIIKIQRLGPIP